ncbi:hypothetical protein, partial [Rubricoccus marinus]
ASFSADTILVDQNARIKADYEFQFSFDLTQDDGLVVGRIRAMREGDTVYREAGFTADTTRYQSGVITNDDIAGGTFVEPVLELDVEDGPYSDNLWTFEVIGSRADSENYILHERTFVRRATGEEFTLTLRSDKPFTMYRRDRPEELEQPETKTAYAERFRAAAASLLHRSEQ